MIGPKKHGFLLRPEGTAWKDVPGIVIADGGLGRLTQTRAPRLRAFIYGEELPSSPTLPFGRWKA